jgi:mannose-6-phosphate isomerase
MTKEDWSMIPIQGIVKNYPWGSHTTLAQHRGEVRSDEPEAELWFGDYPQSPARIVGSTATLDQVTKEFGQLSFLAKILAVEESLSLQVHPALADIAALRDVLKDDNHKPEMVVALSEFHALVGLAPTENVLALLERLDSPKVKNLLAEPLRNGGTLIDALDQILGIDDGLGILDEVLEKIDNLDGQKQKWLRKLIDLYAPKLDPLALLVCELVVLQPGESLYLPPRCIHAYLHGTVVEVMANSDNVIRGGLTNKPIDKKNFLSVIDSQVAIALRIDPVTRNGIHHWIAPTDDFELRRLEGKLAGEITIDEYAIAFTSIGSVEVSRAGTSANNDEKVVLSRNDGALLAPGRYLLKGRASLWVVTGKGR